MGLSGGYRGNLGLNSFKAILYLAVLLAAGLLSACEEENVYVPPPPPAVSVAQPLQQTVTEYLEFTGTTVAVESVEVRARVAGILKSMHFKPGTRIEQGDLLFVIDPKEYQADLNAAQAELDSARALLKQADIELERAQVLFAKDAVAEVMVVEWRTERNVRRAAVKEAQARVERTELNLGYTQVTAPIDGRVARNMVDPGNLVGEGEATLLTTIKDYDPMFVYFDLNERDLLRVMEIYRARAQERGFDPRSDTTRDVDLRLYLGLSNEEGYPHEGVVDFAESGVDAGTGTLQVRGVFANEEMPPVLVPGLFTRVRMPIQERPDALLVSERAIGADQEGRYLLVVNDDKEVEKRPIRIGQLVDGLHVIEDGLDAGEWVIVNGLQRARQGATVAPEEIEMTSLTISALRDAAQARTEEASATARDASATTEDVDDTGAEPASEAESAAGSDGQAETP